MEQTILEVSQVNAYIKGLFDRDELLGQVCVHGELSNYKVYPSGHHYFTMKDAEGALRCVMFRSSAARLRFRPENGMQVLAVGRITVFPRDGAYQLYCENLAPAGVGDLHVAFEQLKAKLLAEGRFDRSLKKPLPPYPHTIGIITSGAGAAAMPLGAASAFPMSSRVIAKMAKEEDPYNFILMQAAGANVAGQVASVIAGGIILAMIAPLV